MLEKDMKNHFHIFKMFSNVTNYIHIHSIDPFDNYETNTKKTYFPQIWNKRNGMTQESNDM